MDRRQLLKRITLLAASGVVVAGMPWGAHAAIKPAVETEMSEEEYARYLEKIHNFNRAHSDDLYLSQADFNLLITSVDRFKRLQNLVGHANFYLLSFDDALRLSRSYTSVGSFSKYEIEFLEKIFYSSASTYGFFGEKPLKNLTDRIQRRRVTKVPHTGNFLYKGKPEETYKAIQDAVGEKVILTSGVRSVIKQFLLFLDKALRANGNLSLASRSLAPPGYSFHGVGDFDVGQVGYGERNFTEDFVQTPVFKRLNELGYIRLRYPRDNNLGVRFEPWHVKVPGV
ncbi:MAG: D-alanyl-D-alanine carboxypeptidase family protein [Magnetococcales bacterium]|nr:D-alanyl-D-alanine carboxypeptidase family protein [Magnetococcales bacterium]